MQQQAGDELRDVEEQDADVPPKEVPVLLAIRQPGSERELVQLVHKARWLHGHHHEVQQDHERDHTIEPGLIHEEEAFIACQRL